MLEFVGALAFNCLGLGLVIGPLMQGETVHWFLVEFVREEGFIRDVRFLDVKNIYKKRVLFQSIKLVLERC